MTETESPRGIGPENLPVKEFAPHGKPEGACNADEGIVFNVQRFSLHDGPGIRTTVFLQGCPLRCFWCANPESRDPAPHLMLSNRDCRLCGACVKACPSEAIRIVDKALRTIDWGKCNQCLLCVDACMYHGISRCGTVVGVQEVLGEVMRDEAFYANSDGGVTLSGGEPLLQIEFAAQLLEALKGKGLHTAVDTSGHVPWTAIETVLPYVDLFLWDIKHLDREQHREATGVVNDRILENLENASRRAEIWLRLPLIAGYNDGVAHIQQLVRLGKKVGAQKISLLPYHEGGRLKYEQMGEARPSREASAPSEETIRILKETIEREDMAIGIGS